MLSAPALIIYAVILALSICQIHPFISTLKKTFKGPDSLKQYNLLLSQLLVTKKKKSIKNDNYAVRIVVMATISSVPGTGLRDFHILFHPHKSLMKQLLKLMSKKVEKGYLLKPQDLNPSRLMNLYF